MRFNHLDGEEVLHDLALKMIAFLCVDPELASDIRRSDMAFDLHLKDRLLAKPIVQRNFPNPAQSPYSPESQTAVSEWHAVCSSEKTTSRAPMYPRSSQRLLQATLAIISASVVLCSGLTSAQLLSVIPKTLPLPASVDFGRAGDLDGDGGFNFTIMKWLRASQSASTSTAAVTMRLRS